MENLTDYYNLSINGRRYNFLSRFNPRYHLIKPAAFFNLSDAECTITPGDPSLPNTEKYKREKAMLASALLDKAEDMKDSKQAVYDVEEKEKQEKAKSTSVSQAKKDDAKDLKTGSNQAEQKPDHIILQEKSKKPRYVLENKNGEFKNFTPKELFTRVLSECEKKDNVGISAVKNAFSQAFGLFWRADSATVLDGFLVIRVGSNSPMGWVSTVVNLIKKLKDANVIATSFDLKQDTSAVVAHDNELVVRIPINLINQAIAFTEKSMQLAPKLDQSSRHYFFQDNGSSNTQKIERASVKDEKNLVAMSADRYDLWMKQYHGHNGTHNQELVDWLSCDHGGRHVKSYDEFCKLAAELVKKGYKTNPPPSEMEFKAGMDAWLRLCPQYR